MAELALKDRLQPSLLDRLRDDEPSRKRESREARVLTVAQLREHVRRDLAWLLNTENLESAHDLADFPHAARSVLNYGMPSLAGSTVSSADIKELEAELQRIVTCFEPRILPGSVDVRASVAMTEMNPNALTFEIRGELWARPLPLMLHLKTELDLETGDVDISELQR